MEKKNTLGLTTPERNKAPSGSFLTSPQEIKAWIAALPVANVGETARQVFKALVEFNRLEMPATARLKIVEQFREPARYIAKNLEKHYFDAPLPLSAKSRKIAILNRELYSELAIAYKIFIEQMISSSARRFDQKQLIVAVHRAMQCKLRLIYYSVIIYDPIPNGTWREIHRLYTYSELNNVHNISVKCDKDNNTSSTIAELYKQILLFSLSSPFRLREREIRLVYASLPEWAPRVTLGLPDPERIRDCHFISRLWSDAPPSHVALQTKEASKRSRELSTTKLASHIKKMADKLIAEGENAKTSSEHGQFSQLLLDKLYQAFSNAPKRKFVRTKLNFKLNTAVGLSNIHILINAKPVLLEGVDSQPVPYERHSNMELDWLTSTAKNAELRSSLYNLSDPQIVPNTQNVFFNEDAVTNESDGIENCHEGAVPAWASNGDCPEAETFSCKTINESAGGYCINWSGDEAPPIKIGEVIGIQSAGNQNKFGVGISRWIKNNPGQGLLLGMEVIASNCDAVGLRPATNLQSEVVKQKGLLLPESKASKQVPSLVLPTLPYKVDDLLIITTDSGEEKIKLTELIELTGAFAHFNFIGLGAGNSSMTDSGETTEANFDNIWSHI